MASTIGRQFTCLVAVALLAVSTGCRDATGPGQKKPLTADEEPHVSLGAMQTCLEDDGVTIGDVQPSDPRMQALRDLAQRTSFDAMLGERSVAVAVPATASEARLLAELLEVPDDPYSVAVAGNVVVMYQPDTKDIYRAIKSCLGR